MAFLPVEVPGGQGGRPVFIDPDEVIMIRSANVPNTTTTIVFRHQQFTAQVDAPDTEVLKALQCNPRVQTDCCGEKALRTRKRR